MLQVWLPLNKDFRNCGLDKGITVTNYGTTFNQTGSHMLNTCCAFATNQYFEINGFDSEKYKHASFSLWVYYNSAESGLFFTGPSTSHYLMASQNGTGNYYHQNVGSPKVFVDGVQTLVPGTPAGWHHYCIVDADLTSWTGGTMYFNRYGSTGAGWNFAGRVCDIKIFDHAIDVNEVAELSKVFDFNGVDWTMPQHNNTWNSLTGFNTCYNAAYSTYGFNTTATSIYETSYYEKDKFGANTPVIKVYTTTDRPEAFPYVNFAAAYIAPTSAAGETFRCLSFDYWPYSRDRVQFYSYRSGYVVKYLKEDGTWSSWGSTCSIPVTLKTWNHVVITWAYSGATQANMGDGPGYMQIGSAKAATNTSDYWLFKNIQVEKREEPTPYSRVGREMICADRSAMKYPLAATNLIVSGSSAYFNGSSSYVSGTTLGLQSGGTISIWAIIPSKPTVQRVLFCDPSSKMVVGFLTDGNLLSAANGSKARYLTTGITWGQMTNIIVTYGADRHPNGAYINGVAAGTGGTSNWTTANTAMSIGRRMGVANYDDFFNGYINNIQVFGRAFTAAEAKALYDKGPQKKEDFSVPEMWRGMMMEYSGCTWLRVLHHNNPAAQRFTAENCTNNDNPDLFSKLYLFDDPDRFKMPDGKYEFMVREKLESTSTENVGIWVQTSSPTAATVAGYSRLYQTTDPGRNFGLVHQTTRTQFDNKNQWWCACGCYTAYNGGIPGFWEVVKTGYMDLYIRVDGTKYFNKM